MDPVLVVGAGLSAADAIMAARFRGIPVLHAFRDSSNDWSKEKQESIKLNGSGYDRLQWLPLSIYPEYHKVYEMMSDGGTNYPLYKALPGCTLMDLSGNSNGDYQPQERRATLCTPDGQLVSYKVSLAAILIGKKLVNLTTKTIIFCYLQVLFSGSKPDLSYLKDGGIGLGKFQDRPIDSRWNPIEVDDFTYEVLRAPRTGLYALGPLVGDNFVRFILGGAFAILVHIQSTCK